MREVASAAVQATFAVAFLRCEALSERLEELRRERIAATRDSVEFLKRLLEVVRQLVGAERAEAEGRLDSFQVLDPDRGALTQILSEYAPPGVPVIVGHVVEEIDALVRSTAGHAGRSLNPATATSAASCG